MSCGCENRKRQEDLAKMRGLARKAAKMEGRVYEGKLVEYVWH